MLVHIVWTSHRSEQGTLAGARHPPTRRVSGCAARRRCSVGIALRRAAGSRWASWPLGCHSGARASSLGDWPLASLVAAARHGNLSSLLNRHHKVARGGLREAHLPTEQSSPCQEARLPPPHEHPSRQGSVEVPSRQGSPPSFGLIWRIRERSAFTRIASQGRRARAGVLWCTYVLDPPGTVTPPRVAYALGRALGPAVVRNRVRRRLRAMLRQESSARGLPPGSYLFGAQPAAGTRSFVELQFDLQQLLARIRA